MRSLAGRRGSPFRRGWSAPWSGTCGTAAGGSGCGSVNIARITTETTEHDDHAGDRRERAGREPHRGAARRGRRARGRRRTRGASRRRAGRVRRDRSVVRARQADGADRVGSSFRRDQCRRDDGRRRLRDQAAGGLGAERAGRGSDRAGGRERGRAPHHALHGLRLRRHPGQLRRGRPPQPARHVRADEARRRGSGADPRPRRGGVPRGRHLQRPQGSEEVLRGERGRFARFREAGEGLRRPGGLADPGGQRGRAGDRRPSLRGAGPVPLLWRDRDLPAGVLPGNRATAGGGRVADRPGAARRSEAACAETPQVWSAGGQGEAAAGRIGAIAHPRRPGPLHRGAPGMTEVADRAPAASAPTPARGSALAELLRYRQLVAMLVVRELKVRYKRSVLGLLWTMLNPLLLMVVYTVVFATIMRTAERNFAIFVLSGLLPWLFFSVSLVQGLNSIIANQELIRKIRIPQAVFPLSVVGSNLVNFTLSLLPLLLLMAVLRQPISPALLFLPLAMLILAIFTTGATLLLATFTVFFRDVRHLTEVLLQMLLYLSPVFYNLQVLPQRDVWWFHALQLVLGFAVFQRLSPRHIHYL